MDTRKAARCVSALACCAALLGQVAAARGNIGPRWWGDVTTEPWGVKGVAITREELTLDLRPLLGREPVRVGVTYHLSNEGTARKLDLLFVSGASGVSEFEARLDGRLRKSAPLSRDELRFHWERFPDSWKPPQRLPGIDREETYFTMNDWKTQPIPVAFSVELPSGPSTLSVRYRARASGTIEGHPTVTWQFPYVLAPAREWGGFGRLDVTAYLPDDWEARSTPALEREGGVLRGQFTGIPADTLALAVRAPVPPGFERTVDACPAIYGLAVVGSGFFCRWVGRRIGRSLARRCASSPDSSAGVALRLLPVAASLMLLWPALIYAAARLVGWVVLAQVRGQANPYLDESLSTPGCANDLVMAAAVLLGAVVTLRSATSRAAMPEPVAPRCASPRGSSST